MLVQLNVIPNDHNAQNLKTRSRLPASYAVDNSLARLDTNSNASSSQARVLQITPRSEMGNSFSARKTITTAKKRQLSKKPTLTTITTLSLAQVTAVLSSSAMEAGHNMQSCSINPFKGLATDMRVRCFTLKVATI